MKKVLLLLLLITPTLIFSQTENNNKTTNIMKKEVWKTIQEMNKIWTEGKQIEKLNNYFHKDMVAITPTDSAIIVGRENCVNAWGNFSKSAKIIFWKELEPKIQIYGNGMFAIVTYYFDMSFEMNGQKINMKGRDMFSLVKENDKWWIVADQFSQYPNQ